MKETFFPWKKLSQVSEIRHAATFVAIFRSLEITQTLLTINHLYNSSNGNNL